MLRRALVCGLALASACGGPLPEAETPAAVLYARRCGECHRPYQPRAMTWPMWEYQLGRMRLLFAQLRRPWLTEDEEKTMVDYLKRHAGSVKTIVLFLAVVVTAGCDRVIDRVIERRVTQNFQRADRSLLASRDLTVVLCGTGGPLADAQRAGACTALVAGGVVMLVDVGPGSWETLDLANVPPGALGAVFLTHFHSDHIGDLGEAATQSWIAGRTAPLDVYGPVGTARLVDGFVQAYAGDADARTLHHGDAYLPRAAAAMRGHDVPLGDAADAGVVVLDREGFRVTMFRVDHDPVRPAVGYRFDYHGRSVVVSGDTKKSASLVTHAKGADLLVHETLVRDMFVRAATVADGLDLTRLAKLARDATDYHTTPVEAAEVARDAGVRTLVFSHIVPGPPNWLLERRFLAGAADVFSGEIVAGRDGMRFTLKAKE